VWLIHTQKASDLELDALMDGINLYLPKIEVKRWPKSRLVFGGITLNKKVQILNSLLLCSFLPGWVAVNALLKCSPHEKLHQKLFTCIQSLTWDIPGRYSRNNFRR